MKKHFTLVFSLMVLLLNTTIAQNFQGIRSDRTAIYKDCQGIDLLGVEVDNAGFDTDSVFEFSPTILPGGPFGDCYRGDQASWLGNGLSINSEGIHVFKNHADEDIIIKALAALNEEWICYSNTEFQVIAKVNSVANEAFLSIEDIVKTIGFEVKDLNGNLINHQLNQMTIKLSENYGFIRVLNFYYFPNLGTYQIYPYSLKEFELYGLNNPSLGRGNLTWQMIHDHQPGDELHTVYYDVVFHKDNDYQTDSVCKIAKFLERGMSGDTIVYKVYEKKRIYKKATGQAAQVSTTEDTVWVKIPKDHIINNLAGEATAVFGGSWMVNLQANSGTRLTKSFEIVLLYEDDQYEDCWSLITTDGCPDGYEYIEGLGGPYTSCSVAFMNNSANHLVYYKKGQEEWGEPLNIIMLGLQEEKAEDYCQLIQKPGEQSFVLQLNGDVLPYEVQLINMNGQLVELQKINEASWRFENTAGLKGVFIVKLINSKNQVFSRKIVF